MKLDTLKDLEQAIKLCRKLGVDTIEIGDVKFQLSPTPPQIVTTKRSKTLQQPTIAPGGITDDVIIPTTASQNPAGLTDEQLLFYSVGFEQN